MKAIIILVLPLLVLQFYRCSRTNAYPVKTPLDCIEFLRRYGYINEGRNSKSTPAVKALQMYQDLMGLPVTGLPDQTTMTSMNQKRCGNPDVIPGTVDDGENSVSQRSKRYILIGPGYRWRSPVVTYRVSQYSHDRRHRREVIDDQIDKAFQRWEAASNIRFNRSSDQKVDIEIKFVKQDHEDNRSFDGPGEVLAHAFPPGDGIGGDVHFDDEEVWDVTIPSGGANFPWVVLHEVGHALGLAHSRKQGSIMWPVEEEFGVNLDLSPDDIKGIQALYGEKQPSLVETPFSFAPAASVIDFLEARQKEREPEAPLLDAAEITRPDLCRKPKIDAIVTLENGQVFAFSGHYAIRLRDGDKAMGPADIGRINYFFPNLTASDIDAAVTSPDGVTYVFKGRKVWKFRNFMLEKDQSVPKVFKGFHANLDAVFRSGSKFYLIQGNNFIVRQEGTRDNLQTGKLSELNIPDHKVTSAWNSPSGDVFLFHNDRFWVLEQQSDGSLKATTSKPMKTRTDFLHCTTKIRRGFVRT